jgi:hypothetical protein
MNDNPTIRTICLTLIVRDEASNIEDCINSTAGHLNSLAVVDTGSVDSTLSLVSEIATKLEVPSLVETHEWTDDFSIHRNQSISLARKISGEHAFALMLDADERVLAGLESGVEMLQRADVVSGWLVDGSFRHTKTFLARLSCITGWRGARHEFIVYADDTTFAHCGGLLVSYGNHGYRRRNPTTYEKDLAQLEEMMSDVAGDHRSAWLYARTLEASGRFGDASSAYTHSLAQSMTEDATFQSVWGVARCEHQSNRPDSFALSGYENLVTLQPRRAEGWLGLAQIAFEKNDFEQAFEHATRAMECTEPFNTAMYDRAGYTWLSREIAARALLEYKPRPDEALDLLAHALECKPDSEEDLSRINELISELRDAS